MFYISRWLLLTLWQTWSHALPFIPSGFMCSSAYYALSGSAFTMPRATYLNSSSPSFHLRDCRVVVVTCSLFLQPLLHTRPYSASHYYALGLILPATTTDSAKRITHAGAVLWNVLPPEIRCIANLPVFKPNAMNHISQSCL